MVVLAGRSDRARASGCRRRASRAAGLALLPLLLGVSRRAAAQAPEEYEKVIDQLDLQTLLNTPLDAWTASKTEQRHTEAPAIITSLTAGVRYDRHSLYGGQLSRRAGVVANPRPNLHAKLLHGSAFKAPSPLLLYAVPSARGDVIGNVELRPQYVNTFELQVSWEPSAALSLSTDLAYSLLRDKTEFIQQGINKEARNVSRAATLSWESLAELRHREWLRARLSLELQRTLQRTGQGGYAGRVLGSVGCCYPAQMVHAEVAVQPPGSPLRAAISASCIGTRRVQREQRPAVRRTLRSAAPPAAGREPLHHRIPGLARPGPGAVVLAGGQEPARRRRTHARILRRGLPPVAAIVFPAGQHHHLPPMTRDVQVPAPFTRSREVKSSQSW